MNCRRCAGSGVEPSGEGLRMLRLSHGATLRLMAERIGYSHVYLSLVERGECAVSGRKLLELSEQYEAACDDG